MLKRLSILTSFFFLLTAASTSLFAQCPEPDSLEVLSVTDVTANLQWVINGSEGSWDIEIVDLTLGESATGTPTSIELSNTPLISGLIADHEYEVWVRAFCGFGNTPENSIWVGPTLFSTDPSCFPVGDIVVTDMDTTDFTIEWSAGGDETLWNLEIVNTTIGDTLTFTPTSTGEIDSTFNFTNLLPGNDYQVIVQADCGVIDGESAWSDTLFVTTDDLCIIPGDLMLTNLSSTTASISWTPLDGESNWEIEVVDITAGDTQDGVADYFAFTTPDYSIINLLPDNEYYIYVRANCQGSDGFSEWTEELGIFTYCAPFSMPFGETFDLSPLNCWTTVINGINISVDVNNDDVFASPDGNGGNATLTSPLITNVGPSRVYFEWSHNFIEAPDNDSLALYGSFNGGGTWNLLWERTGEDLASNDGAGNTFPGSYKSEYVPLSNAYNNNDISFRFAFGSEGYSSGDTWIDSIGVELMPACNFPYNMAVSNVGETTADVDFDIFGSGVTTYDYEIVPANLNPSGIATGSVNSGINNFNLTGLTPGSVYSLYMMANCSPTNSDWIGPVTFTTECASLTEFIEGFETTDAAEVPMCWSNIDPGNGDAFVINGSQFTGNKSFRMTNNNLVDTAVKLTLVSPELSNINGGTNWLRFYARAFNNAGLDIGTLSDPTDINTFSSFEAVTLTGVYQEFFIDFSNYVGTEDYIAIRMVAPNTNSTVNLDLVKWQEIPTCFPPDDFSFSNVDTTSFELDINPANSGDTLFEVSVVNVTNNESFLEIVTDTVSLTDSSIEGLNPGTFYEIYIRTVCSPTDFSEWTFGSTIGTHCVATDTITEGFEILSPINDFPICWIPFESNDMMFSVSSTWPNNNGARHLDIYGQNFAPAGGVAMASTPALDNIASGTKWLKFYARNYNANTTFKVGTTTDPLDPSTFEERMTISVGSTYQEYTVPFADYVGVGEYITFYTESDGGVSNGFRIDDVSWEDAPECGEPVGLNADTLLANEATISWFPVSQDTLWYLEIVNIPGNTPTGIPTDTSMSTSYSFDNLIQNEIYDVYIKSSCTGATWAGPLTIVTLFENNVAVSEVLSPLDEDCGLTANSEIVIEVANTGGSMQTSIPIEYSWDLTNWIPAGDFTDTLLGGETGVYTLPGTFDFLAAVDSNFWVRTNLVGDSDNGDDILHSEVTNSGDTWLNLEINFGSGATETQVLILDSITGDEAYELIANTVANFSTVEYAVCLFAGATYEFQAIDQWADGWEGGTYNLTACGGITLADNDGLSPDDGVGPPPWIPTVETSEFFFLEGCADYNLSITDIGGPYSNCGLDTNETFEITIVNNGILDLDSADAELQINFNGNGFVTLSDFPNGLAPDSSITFTTDEYDLSTSGLYTVDVSVVFAADEFMDDNTASFDVVNAPTLTSDTSNFDVNNGLWSNDFNVPGGSSWEWGVPTTPILSAGASGSVWATGLSSTITPNEVSYVESPCYDFSAYSFPPEVLYDFIFDGGTASVQLQVSTDGGANWANMQSFSNTAVWTQNVHLLTTFLGESDVKFRFKFDSGNANGVEGFGFDNWEVIEHIPYTDASLLDLEVGGTSVTGFSSTTLSYTVTLPFGATSIPSVFGVVNAPIVDTVMYDEAVLPLPDTTFVTVVAEDTLFSTTYMVIFEEALPSSDNDLSMITVDGINLTGFSSNLTLYSITVPFGGAIPVIDGTVADPTASVVVTQAGSLPGAATLVVTAQDGSTQTYTVNITELPPSTNAFLANLSIDGVTVTGFTPSTLNYTANSFAAPLPIVTATELDPNATSVVVTQVGAIPGVATVVVTAEDGITTMTYTITFNLLLNINANLTGIDVNGAPLAGFSTSTFYYTMELPYGTPVPVVSATLEDPLASYIVNDAAQIPGISEVVVTAENGVIIQTYIIEWTEELPNNNAHLSSINLVAGTVGSMTPGFNQGNLNYLICLGDGNPNLPSVVVTLADTTASYEVINPSSIPGDILVVVTAQDGTSINTYVLELGNCDPLTLEENLFDLAIYPNPNQGSIVIQSDLETDNFKMELINPLGAVVFSKDESQIQLNETIHLDELPNGIYVLRLFINSTWYTERITIMK